MNPLSLLQAPEARRLAEQTTRREWAANTVHIFLSSPTLTETRDLWVNFLSPHSRRSPLLAVINVTAWPISKHNNTSVRFLDLNLLHSGKQQWLCKPQHITCPLTGIQPQEAVVYAVPDNPHLKILCLTPPGWADCYNTTFQISRDHEPLPALNCIQKTMTAQDIPFKGMILTACEALDR